MDTTLLIVSDWSLRQLYHELLFSKQREIIPAETIDQALLLLSAKKFYSVIIYVDHENEADVSTLLRLRKSMKDWSQAIFVLLSSQDELLDQDLLPQDVSINSLDQVELISAQISAILTKKK